MGEQTVAPFAYGTKQQTVQLLTQALTPGGAPVQWELPKAGFIAKVRYLIGGTVTVGVAGTAGTPPLYNAIARHSLNVNFGYEYRALEGDSLYFSNQVRQEAIDPVLGSPLMKNYNPTSATQQTVNMVIDDDINFNDGIDFDQFLIPYQSFSKSVYLQVTPCNALSAIAANTETFTGSALTITPFVTYYTVPDAAKYAMPDDSMVQQILDERKLVNVMSAGAPNLANLTPINGPEYLGLGFKLVLNGANDSADVNTNLDHIRLIANGTIQVSYMTATELIERQYKHFQKALPAGWFYLPFSDDISLVNALGPTQRNVFDTSEYTQLDLEVNLKATAVVGASNYVKLFKRLQSKAVPA